jgi:hypothetical protein
LCLLDILSIDNWLDLLANELNDEFIADVVDSACSVASENRDMAITRIVEMSAA